MKLFLFTTLVSCSLVFAQETGPVVAASNCFNGTFTNGTGGTEGEVPCNFDDHSCLTKIESQNGFFKVDRECLQTQACENNERSNVPKCYPGENGVRQCWFCCRGNLCNVLPDRIPDQDGEGDPSGEIP